MKRRIGFILAIVLSLTASRAVQGDEDRLLGRWECYKQESSAPAAECLYSMEFRDDGSMYQTWWTGDVAQTKHRYSIASGQITVTNEDGQEWHIKYSKLPDGDLSMQMGQWHFTGLLTKNHEKVPQDYGCGFHPSHWQKK